MIKTASTRFQIPELLSRTNIVGVEIGTDQGDYAKELLKTYPGLFLITVDPWFPYREVLDPTGKMCDRSLARKKYAENMLPYEGRFRHIEQTSVKTAKWLQTKQVPKSWTTMMPKVPEPPYDFVFIDAAHDYDSVINDLREWWPLVKVGGVFSGHDFDMPDVSQAVIEFAKRNRCNLQIINEHGGQDMAKYPDGSLIPGTGVDILGTWSRPCWFWFKEYKDQ